MLLANMAVAKKISDYFPDLALLRRHEPPKPKPLSEFLDFALSVGYNIDSTSSASLQASFNEIEKKSPEAGDVLRQLCIKPMQRAKYFCGGLLESAKWSHYALNVPLYTHFTSPIRYFICGKCFLIILKWISLYCVSVRIGATVT